MDDTLQFLTDLPHWRDVLATYAALAEHNPDAPAPQINAETGEVIEEEPWVVRLAELDELDPEELNRTHGRLIALDLLEFTIVNRNDGLGYQITRDGKKVLKKTESMDVETEVSADAENSADEAPGEHCDAVEVTSGQDARDEVAGEIAADVERPDWAESA